MLFSKDCQCLASTDKKASGHVFDVPLECGSKFDSGQTLAPVSILLSKLFLICLINGKKKSPAPKIPV